MSQNQTLENTSKIAKFFSAISTIAILVLLFATLIFNTGSMIHGQLLRFGETLFGDEANGVQYSFLRGDVAAPTCDANPNIAALVAAKMAEPLDEIDLLLGETSRNEASIRQGIESGAAECRSKIEFTQKLDKYKTPALKAYRTIEKSFYGLFHYGQKRADMILMLILTIAAITTTAGLHHLSIRPPSTRKDFLVYSISMVTANVLALVSYASYLSLQIASGIPIEFKAKIIHCIWIVLFASMLVISLYKLVKPPKTTEEGSYGMAGLAVPLYASMSIIATLVYMFSMHYPAATAVYLSVLTSQADLFLSLSLFIWSGMLLKQTNVTDAFINFFRPFNLAPETITYIIMLGAAFATAFTGASGVFIIAAGAIIYREVINAGGRRQFALATTAMSGSLGVVLSPCLLIVLVAALNKEVTTDVLYSAGIWVFILSSTTFYILSLMIAGENKFKLAPLSQSIPGAISNLRYVVPYFGLFAAGYLFYFYALDTKLDEFTAPMIMPIIIVFTLIWDHYRNKKGQTLAPKSMKYIGEHAVEPKGVFRALFDATHETKAHIGALIILMAFSVVIGGLIERSEMMPALMESLNLQSTLAMITLTVVMMVIVGMIMDPFGAVILVSGIVAPIAYKMGVHPVHFWMIVLTAFELGYLSPPVALNQLLARQVVGEDEMKAADLEVKDRGFFWKYERWVLPVMVMGFCLLVVAYFPYFTGILDFYPSKVN